MARRACDWSSFRSFFALFAALLLAACASLSQNSLPAEKTNADSFSLTGRIALREQDRILSGSIRWQHDAAHDDILLLSPLGQGVMQIERDATGAMLRTSDGKQYRAPDAEELAFNVTGWHVPVAGLTSWVRAAPTHEAVASVTRDEYGRLAKLVQQGTNIEYQAYFDAPGSNLPKRIVVTRPEFELKLIVDSWDSAAQ